MKPKFKVGDRVDIYEISKVVMNGTAYTDHVIVDVIDETMGMTKIYSYILRYKDTDEFISCSYPEDTLRKNTQYLRNLRLEELGILD